MDLAAVISELKRAGGVADPPPPVDPFALVVWEVCAYLVDDARRAAVYERLVEHVGVTPEALLTTDLDTLSALLQGGGMHPERRAVRLREAAEIADDLAPDGDLLAVAQQPLAQAVKAFRRFPSHGRPGAERVLLLSRAHAVLSLDSNGLRVLLRLGVAREQRSYDATYRAMREALAGRVPLDLDWTIGAHLLLRRHGKTICRTSAPACELCPVAALCPSSSVA